MTPQPGTADAALARRKTCTKCHAVKTWGEFNARTKWPDGRVRTVQSWCTECVAEYDREAQRKRAANPTPEQVEAKKNRQLAWRMRNLEAVREKDRRIRAARLAADPEGFREKQRQIAARYRQRMKIEAERAAREADMEVPIGPFAEWLRHHAETNNLETTDIGARAGVDESQVRRWMMEKQATIRMRTLDRALCNMGRPEVLTLLYPYGEEQEAA